ncbi:MAG: 2-C-methyl-D-erythritol 4-phosphate cytidylyltransferase [Candidatus Omnitrophica bacterium]|nr:2-C-methyl-D-erythritol 4-phosphate cytidylyltransferase [Candidatus Omnitrophota bacterium]
MTSAIVVAAGKGKRFAGRLPKIISRLGAKPVIYYSLLTLNRHPGINEIIVVASRNNIKEISAIIRRYKINKVKKVVLGGKERKDSVFQGLKPLSPDTGYVLIHDGARPFISAGMVSSVLGAAKRFGAAIVGAPVKYTVKEVFDNTVVKTLNRESLWEIQTPQVFKKKLILEACKKAKRLKVTDDAMLVEKLGGRVKVVFGSYSNIKITTAEDLILAEAILKKGLCQE